MAVTIETKATSKNGAFFRLIQKKGTIAFDVLYTALIETYQFDVADLLKPELAPSRENANIGVEETTGGPGASGGPGAPGGAGDPGSAGRGAPLPGGVAQREPVYEEVDRPPQTPPTTSTQPDDWDTDSVLSDTLEYLDERSDILDDIRLRLVPCRRPKIRKLFYSDTVYRMSAPVRGRCLIINNKDFDRPTAPALGQVALADRHGSDMDVSNISSVFKHLKFEYTIHTDKSGQDMLKVLEKECEHPAHKEYGMFVLVVMTHGNVNRLYGKDGRSINVSDIYDRMSAYRFPSMAGKPKLIILQACSGDRTDTMGMTSDSASSTTVDAKPTVEQIKLPSPKAPQASVTTEKPMPGDYLATDDLYIMKASFLSYVSSRHERQGTWFIRAMVEALYKHACHRDIQSIFEHVKNKVRAKSILASRASGYTSGQQPTGECFFTGGRKLYLFPDYNPSPPAV